ncbi:MAG: hypothetical protein UW27_C0001G0019 [Parcubacteria group bacterium GW2011_GWA1_44_13]|uniref:Uncharacterized protein n=1 Tax=Candidatus Nomurabacteria bacterium GW2011_GWB1_44_12 TaxID=1618748 RepID=A0A837IE74_9BACT|nr:MAG: hypothetical protein UW25_C0001G0020 [Candidatus Nomurabacteria bacterium GW2011_GWB1_44_12]KKT38523.1 MAG: hypothetical protein UW27_C0001G0019 [Parcubacteria group bacterium GW2011_GWA1_44_13]KKT60922.1 MAG: hypothetical protein UW54_C0001G0003 [Parcubacteria group bacterium GW2011_GWC1_44_26]
MIPPMTAPAQIETGEIFVTFISIPFTPIYPEEQVAKIR